MGIYLFSPDITQGWPMASFFVRDNLTLHILAGLFEPVLMLGAHSSVGRATDF